MMARHDDVTTLCTRKAESSTAQENNQQSQVAAWDSCHYYVLDRKQVASSVQNLQQPVDLCESIGVLQQEHTVQIAHAELKTHLPCHEGPYGEIEHVVIFLNNTENRGHISDAAKSCHDCIQLVT